MLLASERSERGAIRGNQWKSEIYLYIYIYIYMVRETHFSSVLLELRHVEGVKCQPFLKHSNHWKRAQKSGCFQFPEAVVISQQKKAYALPKVVHYKFSLFRSRKCGVESAGTTVTIL